MKFKSGLDFEDFVFGHHSDGYEMECIFEDVQPNFDRDVRSLIESNLGIKHPNTHVGEDFFRRLNLELRRKGINTDGLVFLSTIGSLVDWGHHADGLVYLPAVSKFPITIDVYSIDEGILNCLRESWSESFPGLYYTFAHFQTDLFRYKIGRAKWLNDAKKADSEGFELSGPVDFREYTRTRRPENHFIWTPQDVARHGRKLFARIFSDYLASKIQCQKMAQQSHK